MRAVLSPGKLTWPRRETNGVYTLMTKPRVFFRGAREGREGAAMSFRTWIGRRGRCIRSDFVMDARAPVLFCNCKLYKLLRPRS